MNHRLTARHVVIAMFLDYMMTTGHYSKLIHSDTHVNMDVLKDIMTKESEFPIYTPTNVLFLVIIMGMLNNQVSLFSALKNISRDLESDSWIDIISKVVELRSFEEDNSSKNKNFFLYDIQRICQLYPQFHKSVHKFIKEELFKGIEEVQEMFPYCLYTSIPLENPGEYQLITKWPSRDRIKSYYWPFKENPIENYQSRNSRVFSLPFEMTRDMSVETANFLLYSLSFHFTTISWDSFEYLNENYDV